MAKYIDIEPVIKQLTATVVTDDSIGLGIQMGLNRAMEILAKAPIVEAEPVVHAHWFGNDDPQGWFDKIVYCSSCKCGDSTVRSPRCRYCGAHMDEKRSVPMYLGKCEETDCEHWRWSGDSYHDRNTECFCLLNGKSVYRHEVDEKRIECPLGKMMEEEVEYD